MGEIRFGCFLPVPSTPTEKLLTIAKVNEGAGFDSIWAPDHLLFIPPGIVPEAWSTLSAIAVVTEKSILGSCVSDPHRHHPAVLAQMVATVDRISGGRTILGLGAGEAMNLDPFGMKWNMPVSRLVEAVSIIRKLWSGSILDFEGRFWKLSNAFLQIAPTKGSVPIYLGANSPRTLRLTGEVADGWLSTPLTPRLYRKRVDIVKNGAKKVGRSPDELDMGVYLYTSIADQSEEAYTQIEKMKIQTVASPQLLQEAGYNVELPKEMESLSYFKATLASEWMEKLLAYGELIPREAAIEFSIAGTVEDCIDKIEEFIKAGVRHLILVNVGPDPRQVMRLYSEKIIPHFKSE
jgi:alkanesulfonate monooxygenase SsuD/methylene tetrahydromethanopterin reductase-like flavin-dependent oxidoreductase (luciferase family)